MKIIFTSIKRTEIGMNSWLILINLWLPSVQKLLDNIPAIFHLCGHGWRCRMTLPNKCEKTWSFSFKIFKLKCFHFHSTTLRVTRTGKAEKKKNKYKQLSKSAESPCYMLASIYMKVEYHSVLEAERVSRFKILVKSNCVVVKFFLFATLYWRSAR